MHQKKTIVNLLNNNSKKIIKKKEAKICFHLFLLLGSVQSSFSLVPSPVCQTARHRCPSLSREEETVNTLITQVIKFDYLQNHYKMITSQLSLLESAEEGSTVLCVSFTNLLCSHIKKIFR